MQTDYRDLSVGEEFKTTEKKTQTPGGRMVYLVIQVQFPGDVVGGVADVSPVKPSIGGPSPRTGVFSFHLVESGCRRVRIKKAGPASSRCQVTSPVVLVVIVSTGNHAMITHTRGRDAIHGPNRSFLKDPPGYIKGSLRNCTDHHDRSMTATMIKSRPRRSLAVFHAILHVIRDLYGIEVTVRDRGFGRL